MDPREYSSLRNAEMVDEPNYNVENMPDFSGVPIPAKPLNIYRGDSWVKQIKDYLKQQIHRYNNKVLEKLEKEENPEQAIVLHKILAIRDPERPRKFPILDRAKNWTIHYRRRTDPKTKDHSFDHWSSSKQFRSQKQMINYILYEDGEYDEEKTKKKKQDVVATDNNENLGSTSSASRNEMTSDDHMVKEKEGEIESETDGILANLDEEFSKITSDQVGENKMATIDSNERAGEVQKV